MTPPRLMEEMPTLTIEPDSPPTGGWKFSAMVNKLGECLDNEEMLDCMVVYFGRDVS